MKMNINYFLFVSATLVVSCSGELENYEFPEQDIYLGDSISIPFPITRTFTQYVPAQGGITYISNIPVTCFFQTYHVHSSSLECESSLKSGSYGWYTISMIDYTRASVSVQRNTSFMSRGAVVGGTYISQSGQNLRKSIGVLSKVHTKFMALKG